MSVDWTDYHSRNESRDAGRRKVIFNERDGMREKCSGRN